MGDKAVQPSALEGALLKSGLITATMFAPTVRSIRGCMPIPTISISTTCAVGIVGEWQSAIV